MLIAIVNSEGQTLDFGAYGSDVSQVESFALPQIDRPVDLPCPVKDGFKVITETNAEGQTYCAYQRIVSSSDLSEGEVAAIAVSAVVFVIIVVFS